MDCKVTYFRTVMQVFQPRRPVFNDGLVFFLNFAKILESLFLTHMIIYCYILKTYILYNE